MTLGCANYITQKYHRPIVGTRELGIMSVEIENCIVSNR